ncbi:MAG: aspartate carbamoyltransferase [Clostridiales bacterium 43-6]|nr:MAG: aspartate carbamoyltransferase [Clostridiales bacterium 43-6]
MAVKHLIDLDEFSHEELFKILNMANLIMKNPGYYTDSCHGKVMATLFYEHSTRTQMSFQTAMLRLGGTVIGFDNPLNSSVSKGESLKDTVRVISNYADLITMRHVDEGAAKAAALYSRSPIINAGDGGHLHPTQTLTDIVTLLETKGTLENLTIGLCGDLKNGRTVHSLIKAMSKFNNNKFVLISTKELTVPDYIKAILKKNNCPFSESTSLADAIGELDVLYMTRIQKERFLSEIDYINQKGVFVLDMEKLNKAKSDLKILHPLPRVDEIDIAVDDDPRAVYFDQTEYGMYARMALILHILDSDHKLINDTGDVNPAFTCENEKCITNKEIYLPKLTKAEENKQVCAYCEH